MTWNGLRRLQPWTRNLLAGCWTSLAVLAGCASDASPATLTEDDSRRAPTAETVTPTEQTAPRAAGQIEPGASGSFEFDGVPLLEGDPLSVWYRAPASDLTTAPIVMVMHGRQRNGREYRDTWSEHADRLGLVVVAPEIPEDRFPGSAEYNLGGMYDDDEDLRPLEEWTFSIIEALFDFVVDDLGGRQRSYRMYGHSAGAQFVQRFVLFQPEHRVQSAVIANAGWYTMLDESLAFPYGMASTAAADHVDDALQTDITVLLGALDIDESDETLRRTEEANAQGPHRLARGQYFFTQGRTLAAQRDVTLGWKLVVVPEIGHDHEEMAAPAAEILADREPG